MRYQLVVYFQILVTSLYFVLYLVLVVPYPRPFVVEMVAPTDVTSVNVNGYDEMMDVMNRFHPNLLMLSSLLLSGMAGVTPVLRRTLVVSLPMMIKFQSKRRVMILMYPFPFPFPFPTPIHYHQPVDYDYDYDFDFVVVVVTLPIELPT